MYRTVEIVYFKNILIKLHLAIKFEHERWTLGQSVFLSAVLSFHYRQFEEYICCHGDPYHLRKYLKMLKMHLGCII